MTITSKDGKSKVSVDVNSAAAVSDDMQKKMEELKKLTPLTTDQLENDAARATYGDETFQF